MEVYGEYFYGNRISLYGLEHNRVDYGTLARAFDCVLNNRVMSATWEVGYWEQVSGFCEDEDGEPFEPDIYQTYIVDSRGAEILKEADEILYYNDELDMYCWGVTHFGTSWDYVLTDIPCNTGKDSEESEAEEADDSDELPF
jgi:hypothetical protein